MSIVCTLHVTIDNELVLFTNEEGQALERALLDGLVLEELIPSITSSQHGFFAAGIWPKTREELLETTLRLVQRHGHTPRVDRELMKIEVYA